MLSLLIATVKDLKNREVPDHVWMIAIPSAFSHIEISIVPVIVLALCAVLYRLDIFGGADAKAISMIAILSPHGIWVFLESFFFCAISAMVFLLHALCRKSKLTMSYPFLPVIAASYIHITLVISEPLLL